MTNIPFRDNESYMLQEILNDYRNKIPTPAPEISPQQAAMMQLNIEPRPGLSNAYEQQRELLNNISASLEAQSPVKTDSSDAEKYFRLAAAFGTPSKTGNFFDALGGINASLADIEKQNREAQSDRSQMALKRLQMQLELAQKQTELSRAQSMDEAISLIAGGNQQATVVDGMAVPSGVSPEIYQAVKNYGPFIKNLPTDKILPTLLDAAKLYAPTDTQKEIRSAVNSGTLTQEQANIILKNKLAGDIYSVVPVSMYDKNGNPVTIQMTKAQAANYYENLQKKAAGQPTGQQPTNTPAGTVATNPSGNMQSDTPPSEAAIAAKKTLLEQKAKDSAQNLQEFKSIYSMIPTLKQAASAIYGMANDPKNKNTFGQLVGSGLPYAAAAILDPGISTPWGSIRGPVSEMVARSTLNKEQLKQRAYFDQPAALLTLAFRKMTMQGQGQISNNENSLAAAAAGADKENPAEALKLKAGTLMIYVDKQKDLIDAFRQFDKKRNGTAELDDFIGTPVYNKIINEYENRYNVFMKKNGISTAENSKKIINNDTTKVTPSNFSLDAINAELARRQRK